VVVAGLGGRLGTRFDIGAGMAWSRISSSGRVEQRHPPGGSGAPFAIRPGIQGGAAQVGEHEDPKRDQSEPDRPSTAPAC
jgi:hypothetical protein